MYRFSADEQHLLVMDCLGLTRWSLPKKLKTDRTYTSGKEGHLSISAAGDVAIAYRDGWCSTARFEMPALKKIKSYDRFRVPHGAISPDGQRIIHTGSFTTSRRQDISDLDGQTLSSSVPEDLAASEVKIHLHPEETVCHLTPHFVISADNSFCHANWGGPLCYGHLDPETLAPVVRWKADLRVPPGRICRAWPSVKGLTIAVFSPGESACTVLTMSPSGEQTRTQTLKAIGLPAVSDRWLAWQEDDDTVVCEDRSTEALERFSVSAVTQQAHSRKNPRPDWLKAVKNPGLGELILRSDQLILLPWHRETFLELRTAVETPRKLPEREHEIRHIALGFIEGERMERAKKGLFCKLVNLDIKRNNLSFTLQGTGKDGGTVGDELQRRLTAAGHRCSGYGYW